MSETLRVLSMPATATVKMVEVKEQYVVVQKVECGVALIPASKEAYIVVKRNIKAVYVSGIRRFVSGDAGDRGVVQIGYFLWSSSFDL